MNTKINAKTNSDANNEVHILWTNADPEVAYHMVFMYATSGSALVQRMWTSLFASEFVFAFIFVFIVLLLDIYICLQQLSSITLSTSPNTPYAVCSISGSCSTIDVFFIRSVVIDTTDVVLFMEASRSFLSIFSGRTYAFTLPIKVALQAVL